MNRHLSFRSGNPALTKNTFKNMTDSSVNKMTLEGTVNKTIIALILLGFVPKVGGHSAASRTPSLPLVPAPMKKIEPPEENVEVNIRIALDIFLLFFFSIVPISSYSSIKL